MGQKPYVHAKLHRPVRASLAPASLRPATHAGGANGETVGVDSGAWTVPHTPAGQ
jgi:hypothetical protein